jgi:hypothetical protein
MPSSTLSRASANFRTAAKVTAISGDYTSSIFDVTAQKSLRFAGCFLQSGGWKQAAGSNLACCNQIEFPVCFLHETRFTRKHVLSPVLYGTGTCVFWRREAEELSIRP